MRILQYIYYKIYRMHSKGEDGHTAAGFAVITTSFIFFSNIFIVGAFLKKSAIIPRFIDKPIEGIVLGLLLIGVDYLMFMHNNKYQRIKERFILETKKKKILGGIAVVLYCFLSFFLLLALAAYKPGKF